MSLPDEQSLTGWGVLALAVFQAFAFARAMLKGVKANGGHVTIEPGNARAFWETQRSEYRDLRGKLDKIDDAIGQLKEMASLEREDHRAIKDALIRIDGDVNRIESIARHK